MFVLNVYLAIKLAIGRTLIHLSLDVSSKIGRVMPLCLSVQVGC